MRRRLAGVLSAALLLTAACGRDSGDVSSERVVASPAPSASVKPVGTKAPAKARGEGTAEATPRRTPRSFADGRPDGEGTPPPGGRATPAPNLANAKVKLTRIASLSAPTAMAMRSGDPAFYIAEKGGRVRPVRDGKIGTTALDISSQVSTGSEQGLLGLAFKPDGKRLFVNFTNTAGDTVIREYDFSGGRATSPRDVLQIDQPYANHNGGNLIFGPDGYLYIGMGDGGSGGDPHNNAQNLDSLLGKMLRIDPDQSGSKAYTSPDSNPFVGRSGRDEIWAYGLRNPWRYSFDRLTKALWIGDVGQNAWEEINAARGGGDGGENYGWRRMEGTHSYAGGTPPSNHHAPIYEYSHDGGNCSVTGGYVYRSSRIRDLYGAYVFADFCAGKLRAFVNDDGNAVGHRFLGPELSNLASFGEDRSGELYVMSLDGGFYRIDPA